MRAWFVDVAPMPPVKEPPPPVIPSLPCPVPMCASPCPYGRKVTSEGCETCECSTAEPEPSSKCPMMKCGMCSFGYVRDDNGCHTCNCLPDPCMVWCSWLTTCAPLMYVRWVEFGRSIVWFGVQGKLCPEHQQCTARWDDCFHVPCPKVAVCTCTYLYLLICISILCSPQKLDVSKLRAYTVLSDSGRGLCLYSNDNKKLISDLREPTDNMSTDCNEDGTFNPVQCNGARNQCWCIDDTGREIEKTRVPVYSDDDLPTCRKHCCMHQPIGTLLQSLFVPYVYLGVAVVYCICSFQQDSVNSDDVCVGKWGRYWCWNASFQNVRYLAMCVRSFLYFIWWCFC